MQGFAERRGRGNKRWLRNHLPSRKEGRGNKRWLRFKQVLHFLKPPGIMVVMVVVTTLKWQEASEDTEESLAGCAGEGKQSKLN